MFQATLLLLGALSLSNSLVAAVPAPKENYPYSEPYDCLRKNNVPAYVPGTPEYDTLSQPFNLRVAYEPYAVVVPDTENQISLAILCARYSGFTVQAKSGGHSYASFSLGGKNGTALVIDLQKFHRVELQGNGVAKIGAGNRLGDVADALYRQGKRALPHGTCLGVGVGGHSTHGGYGHTSRNWGVMLDTIVKVDMVLPNGTITSASADQNSEIFWAVRGAADSFGVITNFYMQTQPAPEKIVFFAITFNNVFQDKATFTNAVLHLQDFGRDAEFVDNRFSMGMNFNGSNFLLAGNFFGDIDDFNNRIKPAMIKGLPQPASAQIEYMDWPQYLLAFDGGNTIPQSLPYDKHDNFYAKSITVPESSPLKPHTMNALYDHIKANEPFPAPWFTIINLYGGPGSAINKKDSNFAAWKNRDSLFVFQNYGVTAANMKFIKGINEVVYASQPETNFGGYLNYVDPELSAKEAHKLYYGKEIYGRLLALKKKVDPQWVFWNPQAIGVPDGN